MKSLILHICTQAGWQVARTAGEYRAASLDTEGFIHCSRPDQVLRVANLFYRAVPELVLLWVDPQRVAAEIRWEKPPASENNPDVFPHIYGPLNLDAVLHVDTFSSGPDGVFAELPIPPWDHA